jgi:hypothetical protein
MTLPGLVYILCFATCSLGAILLIRSWRRTRTRLLLWTAVSLSLLALNNLLVILDLLVLPDADFLLWRSLAALTAGATLVVGLVWESD